MGGIKKVGKKFENVGKEGSHGTFSTKAGARAQQKAMYANGFKGDAHIKGSKIEHMEGCMVDHDPRISGCKLNPHASIKSKLHKAVSDAYDAHMQEHGLMDEEPGEEVGKEPK